MTASTQDSVCYPTSLQRFFRFHLNRIRSGLAPVYDLIHPDKGGGLANDPFIQDFLISLKSMELGMLRKHCEVWDSTVWWLRLYKKSGKGMNIYRWTLSKSKQLSRYILAPCEDLARI